MKLLMTREGDAQRDSTHVTSPVGVDHVTDIDVGGEEETATSIDDVSLLLLDSVSNGDALRCDETGQYPSTLIFTPTPSINQYHFPISVIGFSR